MLMRLLLRCALDANAPNEVAHEIILALRTMLPHIGASALLRNCFHGSMAGLHSPLSTLRQHHRGCRRMTRGRCGSLSLHRTLKPTLQVSTSMARR